MANNYIRRYLSCSDMGVVMTAAELQAAILAAQKQILNTMSPMRKRDLQRHLARLRHKLRIAEREELKCSRGVRE